MRLYHRYPDAAPLRRVYYCEFWARDIERPGHTRLYRFSTALIDKAAALKWAKEKQRALNAGQAVTTQRQPVEMTIGDLEQHYKAGATCAEYVARRNWHCLLNVLRVALGDNPERRPVSVLSAETLLAWRAKVQVGSALRADRPAASARGAARILAQARSVFSRDLRTEYRLAKLPLPASLHDFLTLTGIKAPVKLDYNKPDDIILARTFQALPELETKDPNLYVAIWLALGFGLRKSEVSEARGDWFSPVAGRMHCTLPTQKNGTEAGRIEIQNGAWAHLAPHIEARGAVEYILTGHATERREEVFRRCSDWMRALGWQTQKAFHEWRAYAICSVAEHTRSLEYASKWARHADITTTQRSYGRYLDIRSATEAPLTLPTAATA
jgi:integrase